MQDKNSPGRALAASFRQMAQQKRVVIPLPALPSRTVEETVAEQDDVRVCHGSRALAVYHGKRDGCHRRKRLPKALALRPEASSPPLATSRLLLGAVSPGLRLTHHDASGHVPAGEAGERACVLRSA